MDKEASLANPEIKGVAPSNIALIKYMGKTSHESNIPTNSSISLTLKDLISVVEIEPLTGSEKDDWSPLEGEQFHSIEMSEKGKTRFLNFFSKLKSEFGIKGSFLLKSANNFPSDCGIASSASSFAALTRAAYNLGRAQFSLREYSEYELSEISRTGSGSSCRSFFEPWSIWDAEGARSIELPYTYSNLLHKVAVVSYDIKEVSSSDAHRFVASSDLFQGRPERAQVRINELIDALKNKNWKLAYELCWQEFWDMHALLKTSKPHFGYMNDKSMTCMNFGRDQWVKHDRGPIITMDAGPNVHFIYRKEDQDLYNELLPFIETLQNR